MVTLTHGSLFSGVGGLDLGFDSAGIATRWQCEIDEKASSVLARHWPKVNRYSDVRTVNGSEVDGVDIVTFGSPCQDLSVAGNRDGFDGTRSSLFFEAIRIIKEMLDATNGKFPRFAVWENVRGALSSNEGADFEAALQALADIGAMDLSWRLVNTCHFGPPQRRVRVFVVADFGGECAGTILAESSRVLWHPHAGRETGTEPAEKVEDSAGNDGCTLVKNEMSVTLTTSDDQTMLEQQDYDVYPYDEYNDSLGESVHHTLRSGTKQSTGVLTTEPTYRVRRLTPRECERLQGWPDDYTRYDSTSKELSDSARYKMCGNGISSPVAQWLGENIVSATIKQEEC